MRVDRTKMVIAGGLAALFVVDAVAMHTGLLRPLDHHLLVALRQPGHSRQLIGPAWGLKLFIAITTLGGASVRAPVTIAAALVLALRERGREAAMLAFAVAGGAIVLPILKVLFDRARPDLFWHLVVQTDWSFPSGHSMGSMILYPLLGHIAGIGRGRARARWLAALSVVLALLIGSTRVLLGVHWASDVIGGWLIGGAVAMLAFAVLGKAQGHYTDR
jgi:undecaprenyl-diphosphatase